MKILTLFLCLFSAKVFGFSDSLKHEKLIWQLPISGGVSFGKNDLTYKNGGVFALNTGIFVEKKGLLYGIDYFYTEFGDAKNFDKKIVHSLAKNLHQSTPQKPYLLILESTLELTKKENSM